MIKIAINISIILYILVTGCVGVPENVTPIENFEMRKYLGTWYEIARLDHSFEKDLIKVTANYSLREDGGLKVINKGFNSKKNEWKKAEGRAYFVDNPTLGQLKVSFFWPFYGGYNIIELDRKNYQYSLVCGPNKSYLWVLARNPNIDKKIVKRLVSKAKSLGFDTEKLIYVDH